MTDRDIEGIKRRHRVATGNLRVSEQRVYRRKSKLKMRHRTVERLDVVISHTEEKLALLKELRAERERTG